MKLQVWTPFFDLEKEMRSMIDRLDRPFGEPFMFRPTTDMVRDEGSLIVTVELPGLDPEKDIDITVAGDMLEIRGRKSDEHEVKEEHRYMHERRFGSFERRIPLPEGVERDVIEAKYDKGVLTVTVPVPQELAEEPAPKKIPVT